MPPTLKNFGLESAVNDLFQKSADPVVLTLAAGSMITGKDSNPTRN